MYMRVDRVHARRDVDAVESRGVRASGISTVAQRGGPRDGVADGETGGTGGEMGRATRDGRRVDRRATRDARCRARALCDFFPRRLLANPRAVSRRVVDVASRVRRATTPTDARAMSVAHASVVRGGVFMGVFLSHDRSNIRTHSSDSRGHRRRRIRRTRRDRPEVRARRRDVFATSRHAIVARHARGRRVVLARALARALSSSHARVPNHQSSLITPTVAHSYGDSTVNPRAFSTRSRA